jgi:syntaxin-binding protein 5
MIEQARSDQQQSRAAGASGAAGSVAGAAGGQEGYWEYMQRQITERTERLGTLTDNVNKLEETSAQWAEQASSYVAKTKRNLIMGAVKGKMGL